MHLTFSPLAWFIGANVGMVLVRGAVVRIRTRLSSQSVFGDSSGAPREASQEEADERHFDERLARLNAALVIEP